MTSEATAAAKVVYQDSVVAFVDILGFSSLISQSSTDPNVVPRIHALLSDIQSKAIMDGVYGSIATFGFEGTNKIVPVRELENNEAHINRLKETWPIAITSFSDSLVLSCKGSDADACEMMLEFLGMLVLACFKSDFFVRGGITMGKLIHQESGPLFGPAFVEAYALESSKAYWPRILVTPVVADMAISVEANMPKAKNTSLLFQEAEDGYKQLTIATALRYLTAHTKHDIGITEFDCLEKIEGLVQLHSAEEKLAKKYLALKEHWLSVFPERVRSTAN